MNANLVSAKLTGNPTESGWVLAHEFVSGDNPQKGQLYALLTSNSLTLQEGKEIISSFQSRYLDSTNSSALNNLKASLESVFSQKFGLVVVILIENRAYIGSFGQVSVNLFRNAELVKLNQSSDLFVASGLFDAGDSFLLASNSFLKSTSGEIIKSSLDYRDISSISENLTPYVRGGENSFDMGALVIKHSQALGVSGFKGILVSLIDHLISLLPQNRLKVRSNQDVSFRARTKKQTAIFFGIALIAILILSILVGLNKQKRDQAKREYTESLGVAKAQLEEARSVKDLSRDRARELLLGARQRVIDLSQSPVKDADLDLLTQSIEDSLGEIAGVYKPAGSVFLDLSLVSSGFKGDKIIASDGEMLVLDIDGQKLVSIDIANKTTQVVSGPNDLGSASDIAAYVGRKFVLTDSGVEEVVNGKRKLVAPKEWGNVLIYVFAGNLYVLDKNESRIWRYPGDLGSFGSKTNWLAPDVSVNLNNAKSWSIDGSIWVLAESGSLLKFGLGKRDFISLSEPVENIDDIYSGEDTSYLYVLDKSSSKVLIFQKNGQFKAEYDISVAGEADKIIISEENKIMILMAGSKLYSIELKHL